MRVAGRTALLTCRLTSRSSRPGALSCGAPQARVESLRPRRAPIANARRLNAGVRRRVMLAHRIVPLILLASSSAMALEGPCRAPPVVSSDAAVCLVEMHLKTAASHAVPLKYEAEEHADYWLVVYAPKERDVRGGGGKLRIDKATGQIAVEELYR